MYLQPYTRILKNINSMNDIRIEKFITALDRYARANLSDYRYEHSCRVATYAEELARRYGYGHRLQRLCYLAGISHDMCKEKPIGFLLRTVRTDGQPVTPDEAANSELLHGRAAAVLLQEHYGIHKKSLLNAVRYHTSASTKFDALGRIIYIADKIEPGRKNCDYLREKVDHLTLDELFLEVLKEVIGFVESKGKKVQACTYKTYRFLKEKGSVQDRQTRRAPNRQAMPNSRAQTVPDMQTKTIRREARN